MRNTNTTNQLSYIKSPMSKEGVSVLYSAHNIKFERCELYGDFVLSLMTLIFNTYMGDEITDSTQQINHFKWCWDKNQKNFLAEGLLFDNQKLYNYFLEFMFEVYYPLTHKIDSGDANNNIITLWKFIFDYNSLKRSE